LLSKGEKTLIRRMEREDVDVMVTWPPYEDPLLADYSFPQFTHGERDVWYGIKNSGLKKCFTVLTMTGEVIGYISLRNVNIFSKKAEMGIVFSPKYVDAGYGRDAITAFLNYYFDGMKYKKLVLRVAAFNRRAYRCYLACGFKYVDKSYMKVNIKKSDIPKDEDFKRDKVFIKRGDNIKALFYRMEIST